MPDNTRKIAVKVTTRDGKDQGAVPTYIEVDRGAGHVRVSGRDLVSNMDETTFELRPGERLVIEGYTPEAVAYDREQAAAFRPENQRNSEGKMDASGKQIDAGDQVKRGDEGQKTGALPTEMQDSRLKSSPGSTVTPAMAAATQQEQANQKAADEANAKMQADKSAKSPPPPPPAAASPSPGVGASTTGNPVMTNDPTKKP